MIRNLNHRKISNQNLIEYNPLSLNPVCYVRGWEGVNLGVNQEITLTDLTGKGYDLVGSSTVKPNVEANGINGIQSIKINPLSYLNFNGTMSEITNLSQRFIWIVFKIDGNAGSTTNHYHNMIWGVGQTSLGSTYAQIFYRDPPFSPNLFSNNYPTNSLDSTIGSNASTAKYAIINKTPTASIYTINGNTTTKTGVQNIGNQSIFIGTLPYLSNFAGGEFLFSEMGILNYTPTSEQILELEEYLSNKYNI